MIDYTLGEKRSDIKLAILYRVILYVFLHIWLHNWAGVGQVCMWCVCDCNVKKTRNKLYHVT